MSKVRSITTVPVQAVGQHDACGECGIAERQARVADRNLQPERIAVLRAEVSGARRRARRLELAGFLAWMILAAGVLWSAGCWLLAAIGVLQ